MISPFKVPVDLSLPTFFAVDLTVDLTADLAADLAVVRDRPS
jgi:hypothetical protein